MQRTTFDKQKPVHFVHVQLGPKFTAKWILPIRFFMTAKCCKGDGLGLTRSLSAVRHSWFLVLNILKTSSCRRNCSLHYDCGETHFVCNRSRLHAVFTFIRTKNFADSFVVKQIILFSDLQRGTEKFTTGQSAAGMLMSPGWRFESLHEIPVWDNLSSCWHYDRKASLSLSLKTSVFRWH